MKEKLPKLKYEILEIIVYISVVLIFFMIMFSAMTSNDLTFLGYSARIVTTGSMEPNIKVNSINIIKTTEIADIKVGDIVCYSNNDDIIHRVTEIVELKDGSKALHTKGDANDKQDDITIDSEKLKGKVIYTFNNVADIISRYSVSPGKLNYIKMFMDVAVYIIIFAVILVAIKNMSFMNDDYTNH